MKIYTKSGDRGETSLYSGGRVGKGHPRIEAYGTIDELNSLLGLLATEDLPASAAARVIEVQEVLFEIGASLADAEGRIESNPERWATGGLECWIDDMESQLEPLRSFILPGGTREAALAHLARTVCRRAERRVVDVGEVADGVVPYLNRLSDALFVLARFLNARRGVEDPLWRSD